MIVPGRRSPALQCDPSLQSEAIVPIIKLDLPERGAEWVSLCDAETSITIISLQSASTLRRR